MCLLPVVLVEEGEILGGGGRGETLGGGGRGDGVTPEGIGRGDEEENRGDGAIFGGGGRGGGLVFLITSNLSCVVQARREITGYLIETNYAMTYPSSLAKESLQKTSVKIEAAECLLSYTQS